MGYNEPLSVSCNRVIDESEGRQRAISFKRLEIGSFQIPAAGAQAVAIEMTATQLALILSGIDLGSARQRKRYRRPAPRGRESAARPLKYGVFIL